MKIRVWYVLSDNGDGSSSVSFFPTEEAAEAYVIQDKEDMGYDDDTDEYYPEPEVSCSIIDISEYEQIN